MYVSERTLMGVFYFILYFFISVLWWNIDGNLLKIAPPNSAMLLDFKFEDTKDREESLKL